MRGTLRSMLGLFALALALATQLGNGCVSDSSGTSGGDDYDRDDSRPQPRQIEDDFVRHPNRIPRSADAVREGYEKLLWQADMNGRYYVYDVTRDRVVHDATISRGQELYVDPKRDLVSINGRGIPNLDLKSDNLHRIYFAAPRTSARDRDDRDNLNDRDDDDTQGPQRPTADAIPRGAARLVNGRGTLAIHAAPDDGTVYVYDERSGRIVHQRELRRGNSFQIFPADGYVNVNSKRAARVRLDPDSRYSLYFAERK